MQPPGAQSRCIRGFTIIELLVVISIMALLVAMLLPALALAREAAHRALCGARQHQVSIAAYQYLDDHDGAFPVTNPVDVQHTMGHHGGKAGNVGIHYSGSKKLLNPYVGVQSVTTTTTGAIEVFRCPSDAGSLGASLVGIGPTYWDRLGMSFWYNGDGNGSNLGLAGHNREQIRRPAKIIYGGDGSMLAWYRNASPSRYLYWHDRKELGWANILFMDGHVRYLKLSNNAPSWARGQDWSFVYND